MSGAGPRSLNAATDPYSGCSETPVSGTPGQQTYFMNSTGLDAEGCPTGGTQVTADWLNGISLSIDYVLTQGGTVALPDACLCENPTLVYTAFLDVIRSFTCDAPDATPAQITDICDNPENYNIATCLADGSPIKFPMSKVIPEYNKDVDGNIISIVVDGMICNLGGDINLFCEIGQAPVGTTIVQEYFSGIDPEPGPPGTPHPTPSGTSGSLGGVWVVSYEAVGQTSGTEIPQMYSITKVSC